MRQFKLTENEETAYNKFCEEHKHPGVEKGAIGGHISITFTPTGIADGVSVSCHICGKKEDITDYDCW